MTTPPVNDKTQRLLDMMQAAGFKLVEITPRGVTHIHPSPVDGVSLFSDIAYRLDQTGDTLMALKCAKHFRHLKTRRDHGLTCGMFHFQDHQPA
jgi:hypothetical protein